MVAGLEDITEGTVRIGDRVVNHVPAKDRDIAMVFQSYALYPHLKVYDNIAFGLRLRKEPKAEIDSRVREAAETLGLTEYLTRPGALLGRAPASWGRSACADLRSSSRSPSTRSWGTGNTARPASCWGALAPADGACAARRAARGARL